MIPWEELSDVLGLGPGTAKAFLGIAGILLVGLVRRGIAVLRQGAGPDDRRRWRSVRTWSLLFLVLAAAVLLGRTAVVLSVAGLSLLLLREGLRLADSVRLYRMAAPAAAALYLWAWLDWGSLFLRAAPLLVAACLLVEVVGRARGERGMTDLAAAGRALWLTVVGPSFVAGVASLPAPEGLPEADMGWMVLLVLLTELNDSAQAWWGRSLGRRRMAPRLSPEKTWAGLIGGVATTTAAALALAPLLTAWGRVPPPAAPGIGPPWVWSALAGLLVALAGTAGDLSASALKRRAGAKDSGTALPGHGGWLDRFDSLAVSAPVYFFVTWSLWHGAPWI